MPMLGLSSMALPPFATVILFALFFANAQQHIAFLVPAVAKSCPNAKKTKQKDTSLQPPPPFRLCQYANRWKLCLHNVALCVRFAQPFPLLMQASKRTGCHIITLCKISNAIVRYPKKYPNAQTQR